jgi:RNA polymerase sigma-70 factor (ECF subfamily)
MMRLPVTDESMLAMELLYREEGARLERALILFAGDREVARDAVAEAFAQAIASKGHLHTPQAWVWRAAFRIAAGELKNRHRARAFPEAVTELPEPLVDLVRALEKLSPKQRTCLILHHYADYPVKVVARLTGSTSGAVTVHLAVGRKRLKELLEDDDDES